GSRTSDRNGSRQRSGQDATWRTRGRIPHASASCHSYRWTRACRRGRRRDSDGRDPAPPGRGQPTPVIPCFLGEVSGLALHCSVLCITKYTFPVDIFSGGGCFRGQGPPVGLLRFCAGVLALGSCLFCSFLSLL